MHAPANRPLIMCYDGSEDAKYAIRHAGGLLNGGKALVVTVWEPTVLLSSFGWAGGTAEGVNFVELDRTAAESAGRVADEGAQIARDVGFDAEPVAIKASGPTWKMILDVADGNDAAAIVVGSRGLGGLSRTLMGSVSTAVVHHADRPALVIHRPRD